MTARAKVSTSLSRHLLAATVIIAVFAAHLTGGGYTRGDGAALAAVISVLAAISVLSFRDSAVVLSSKLWLAPAACIAVVIAVATYQVVTPGFDRELAFLALLRLCAMPASFLLGAVIGLNERRLAAFRIWLCIGILIAAILALIHFCLLQSGVIPPVYFLDSERLYFPLLSPNSTALLCAIGLVMAGGILMSEAGEARSGRPGLTPLGALALAATVVSFIDLGLTRSRSGILMTAVAVLLGLLMFGFKNRRALLYRGLPIAAFAVVAMVVASASRLGAAGDDLSFRLQIYQAHLSAALDRPLLGHGFGSFSNVNRRLTTAENFPALFNINALHNVYLQWMEQAGWIATGAMAVCLGLVLWRVVREARRGRRASVYWLRSAVLVTVVALGQGLLDFGFEHYSIATTLSLILGASFGIAIRREPTD